MLVKLFNSKTRTKVLSLFFSNVDRKYYVQQIIKLTKTDSANTHRELVKLEKLSFLNSKKVANQKYYFLNKDHVYYKSLKELFEVYNKEQGNEIWYVMEEMPNYYPMIVANAWCVAYANEIFKKIGIKERFTKLMSIYDNNMCSLLMVKDEFNKISNEIINTFIEDAKPGEKYNTMVREKTKILTEETEKLLNKNLANLSNKDLYKVYREYYDFYEELHKLHWIQSGLDSGDNLFSKYLMDYLKEKIGSKKYSLGDVFSVLTTPVEEGNATKEYKKLLKILSYIHSKAKLKNYFKNTETRIIVQNLGNIDAKLNEDLSSHVKNYGWMGYGTVGPGWGKDYFIDILGSLVKQKIKVSKLLSDIKSEKKEVIKKQEKFTGDLKIDKTHKRLFKIARNIIFTKGIRKDSMFFSCSVIENLFKEIGKRYYFSVKQIRHLYPHEFKELLLKNKFNASKLNKRYKFSIHFSTSHYKNDKLLEGEKAKKFVETVNIVKEDISNIRILQGDCASPGRVRGRVSIINIPKNMDKMKEGDILVSIATTPDLVPAIKKASVIVTDIGGITCHAAIISRELGIPCIVGTKIATKVLNDGDIVDVDATHGKVNIIKKIKK